MRQRNHQTADPRANATVFLFFLTAHFLKIILASRTNGTFSFAPTAQADIQAKAKEPLLANAPIILSTIVNRPENAAN